MTSRASAARAGHDRSRRTTWVSPASVGAARARRSRTSRPPSSRRRRAPGRGGPRQPVDPPRPEHPRPRHRRQGLLRLRRARRRRGPARPRWRRRGRGRRDRAQPHPQGRGVRVRHEPRWVHHAAHRAAGQPPRLLPARHADDGGRRPGARPRHRAPSRSAPPCCSRSSEPTPTTCCARPTWSCRAGRCPTWPPSASPARRSWSCRRRSGSACSRRSARARSPARPARAPRRRRDRWRAGRVHAPPVRDEREAAVPDRAPTRRRSGRVGPAPISPGRAARGPGPRAARRASRRRGRPSGTRIVARTSFVVQVGRSCPASPRRTQMPSFARLARSEPSSRPSPQRCVPAVRRSASAPAPCRASSGPR